MTAIPILTLTQISDGEYELTIGTDAPLNVTLEKRPLPLTDHPRFFITIGFPGGRYASPFGRPHAAEALTEAVTYAYLRHEGVI